MPAAEALERLTDLVRDLATFPVCLSYQNDGLEPIKCEMLELVSEFQQEISHRLSYSEDLEDAHRSGATLQELRDMCSTHLIGEGFSELADQVREKIPGQVGAELAAHIETLGDSDE